MPIYAALTHNTGPPQLEFVPTDSTQKYPKLTGESLVFKFPNVAFLEKAKSEAAFRLQFGLHKVTTRDLTTGRKEQAIRCETIVEFDDILDTTVWCERCRHFTWGKMMKRKCWKCKQPNQ